MSDRTIFDILSVKGRRAVVTGGSAGIGLGFARALVEAGASVVITGRRAEVVTKAAAELNQRAKDGAKAVAVVADVTSAEDNARVVAAAERELGGLDILINNAGWGEFKPSEQLTAADTQKNFNVNFFGLLDLTQKALPLLKKSRAGRIIHVSSVAGVRGTPGTTTYAATKAAVNGYSRSLAVELAADPATRHITSNAILPGPFLTELFETVPVEARQKFAENVPLKRIGEPHADLSAYAILLASDAGAFTTGQEFVIDGGSIAKF